MLRLTAALAATLLCVPALAYDVVADVTAPIDGGTVEGYVLLMDGVEVAPVSVGANSFPGLIADPGTYVFEVAARNGEGETFSDPVTVEIGEKPGKPGLDIQVTCDPEPCPDSVTITITP